MRIARTLKGFTTPGSPLQAAARTILAHAVAPLHSHLFDVGCWNRLAHPHAQASAMAAKVAAELAKVSAFGPKGGDWVVA